MGTWCPSLTMPAKVRPTMGTWCPSLTYLGRPGSRFGLVRFQRLSRVFLVQASQRPAKAGCQQQRLSLDLQRRRRRLTPKSRVAQRTLGHDSALSWHPEGVRLLWHPFGVRNNVDSANPGCAANPGLWSLTASRLYATNPSVRPRGRLAAAAALLAWAAVAAGLSSAAVAESPQGVPSTERRAAGTSGDIPWLIVQEDEPWAMALAAPVAAHLRKTGPCPLVMAITSPPTREAEWLLSLGPGRRPTVLATSDRLKLSAALQKRSPEVLQIGNHPSEASATVAKRFWNHSREVVVAVADDPEAVILGSALAAGLGVPVLLCDEDEAGAASFGRA